MLLCVFMTHPIAVLRLFLIHVFWCHVSTYAVRTASPLFPIQLVNLDRGALQTESNVNFHLKLDLALMDRAMSTADFEQSMSRMVSAAFVTALRIASSGLLSDTPTTSTSL